VSNPVHNPVRNPVDNPTDTDTWTTEPEPDWLIDQQAQEHTGAPATTKTPTAPPNDSSAEEAVLGAMLLNSRAVDAVLATNLQASDFYNPTRRAVYQAITATIAAGDNVDPVAVHPRITGTTIDPGTLLDYQAACPATSNAATYARRIITCANTRRIGGLALEVAHAASAGHLDEALRRLGHLTDAIPTDDAEHGWAPHNLTELLAGDVVTPPPTVLPIGDGPGLFYEGRTNMIFGEGGSGKSWVALQTVAEAILMGRDAIYIDLEDTAAGIVSRLLLLGLTPDQIDRHLLYVQPELAWGPTAQAAMVKLTETRDIALVVFDSTGEAMAADGVKGNDDDDVARWFTLGPKFIARRGPTVLVIDHIPKDNQHAPLDPIGSQRKKAAIDGACYRIDSPKAPTVDTDGVLYAVCSKDRHGHHQRGRKVAQIAVTHPEPGMVALTITVPVGTATTDGGEFHPTIYMERVSKLLETGQSLSGKSIETTVRGNVGRIREALRLLIVEGYVDQDPAARGFAFRSRKPYRQDAETAPVDGGEA